MTGSDDNVRNSEAPAKRGRSIRVLESVAPPGPTVKYVDQVTRHSSGDTEYIFFSWRAAITRRYDVFHVHWPEVLVKDRSTPRIVLRLLLARLLLWRLRMTRTPIVRTVHNLEPHNELSSKQRRALQLWEGRTSLFVHLNTCTVPPQGARVAVIPHGHYREQFGGITAPNSEDGLFLCIGRIEPYKGVDTLLRVFEASGEPGEGVRVVGSAPEYLRESLDQQVSSWSRADVGVSARFEFVSDNDMVAEIRRSSCVVLPYREMLNSGIALLALSLDRPIIVPRTCTNENLSAEVGPGWVILYDGEFDDSALREARAQLLLPRSSQPNLTGRDWKRVANEYERVFHEVGGGK